MAAVSNALYVRQLRITYNCILQSFEGVAKVTILIYVVHPRRRDASEQTVQLIDLVADMGTILNCRQLVTVLLSEITNLLLSLIVNLAPTNYTRQRYPQLIEADVGQLGNVFSLCQCFGRTFSHSQLKVQLDDLCLRAGSRNIWWPGSVCRSSRRFIAGNSFVSWI
jgi:hypothetical protein